MGADRAASSGPEPQTPESGDWASVTIDTPLGVSDLRRFIVDLERLYHINPLLEVRAFERLEAERYRLAALNLSNNREVDVELTAVPLTDGIEVRYDSGLKTGTTFRVEPAGPVSRLVIADVYGGTEEERRARMAEVDLSLNAWGRALYDYLRHWSRWSGFAPWRWYMRRVWQPMRPSARRIVFMIWVISAVEMAALAAIAALLIMLGGLRSDR